MCIDRPVDSWVVIVFRAVMLCVVNNNADPAPRLSLGGRFPEPWILEGFNTFGWKPNLSITILNKAHSDVHYTTPAEVQMWPRIVCPANRRPGCGVLCGREWEGRPLQYFLIAVL